MQIPLFYLHLVVHMCGAYILKRLEFMMAPPYNDVYNTLPILPISVFYAFWNPGHRHAVTRLLEWHLILAFHKTTDESHIEIEINR